MLANAAFMLSLLLLQRAAGFLSTAILARFLGQTGLGSYAVAQSASQTFYGLSRLGADAGLHVSLAKLETPADRERIEAILGEGLFIFAALAITVGAAMTGLAGPIATRLFGAPDIAAFVRAGAGLFACQMLGQYCYTAFAGLHAFQNYSRAMALGSLLTLLAVCAGAFAGGALTASCSLLLAQTATTAFLGLALYKECRDRRIRLSVRLPGRESSDMLRLGLPFYASGLMLIPVEFACLGWLGSAHGVASLGDLRVTQSLLSIATLVPQALAGPMISHFSGTSKPEAAIAQILDQVKGVWILALATVAGLAAIWPWAIALFFGSQFGGAAQVGQLALLTLLPMLVGTVLTSGLLAMRRSGALLVIGTAQALVLFTLAPGLIGTLGLAGFFIGQTLSFVVAVAGWFVALSRTSETSLRRFWMLPLLALTLMIVVLIAADAAFVTPLWLRGVAAIAAGAILLTTVNAAVISAGDRQRIRTALQSALGRALTVEAKDGVENIASPNPAAAPFP